MSVKNLLIFAVFVLGIAEYPSSFAAICGPAIALPFDRVAFEKGFNKTGIPVSLGLTAWQIQKLSVHYNAETIKQIVKVFGRFKAVRDMEIIGPFRGNATQFKLTLREVSTMEGSRVPIEVVRFSKSDLRTDQGKGVLRTNILIARGRFINLALDRAIELATVLP